MDIDPGGHPRPILRRSRWMSLDGAWELGFGEPRFDRTIEVPFAYQWAASGIGLPDEHVAVLWYRRCFTPPARAAGERLLIHFGAVDFAATVFVDGVEVGSHRGGHTSFTVDASAALDDGGGEAADEVELVVRVLDEARVDQVRGKQTATFPYLVHYTPTSGIWRSVWCEVAGAAWIRDLTIQAWPVRELSGMVDEDGTELLARYAVDVDVAGDVPDGAVLRIDGSAVGDDGADGLGGVVMHQLRQEVSRGVELRGGTNLARRWSPADPHLYPLTVSIVAADGSVIDSVHSYVAVRSIEVDGDRWLLNGEPIRQRLLLDQGYWPDTGMTPPTVEAIRADIDAVLAAGFTGVRRHQTTADPRWLHEADRRGLLVWAEMPSPFWRGWVRGDLRTDFCSEWEEVVRQHRNHPSVVAWVPFNESWGIQGVHDDAELQALVRSVVADTRRLDGPESFPPSWGPGPRRVVVDNSGWCHVDTDVVDVHDYDQDPERLAARWTGLADRGWDRGDFDMAGDAGTGFDLATYVRHLGAAEGERIPEDELVAMLPVTDVWAAGCEPDPGRRFPLVLSEIGGVGFDVDGSDVADRFDYAGAASADDLLARFAALVGAVESIPGLAGWCWTQLADVEQEINGLLTADRRPKVSLHRLRAVLDAAPWGRG